MFKVKKIIYVPLAIIAIALGGAHAVANNQANQAAQELVDELVTRINQNGGQVEVGEVAANPYNKNISVKDVLVTDDAGRKHQIGLLTLSEIELNQEQDFIYAMNISTQDALFTVTGGDGTPEQEQSLVDTLRILGINEDKIGHNQRLAYRYKPVERQLSLNLQNQFYNPELTKKDAAQLFSMNLHTDFSQIPDLESQMQRLRNNEDMTTTSAEWMQTGLIKASIEFEDRGAWQPLIEENAKKAGVSPEVFKNQLKQQMLQQFSALPAISADLQSQLTQASTRFIDSDKPQVELDINSKNPQGTGLMMTFLAIMMSPNALENYFDIQVKAD
ncbi:MULTISPECIES: hypothetical protein [unclassified Methylophaga]|uniref:hypothetical protein n=1 Tax=unclassified Methylophaga TaxID=2629249 RepID=UPI000C94BA70|nr:MULTISPECIES: hypothetical protein [unclassified Methylophaga]MAK66006.1 hypothetical protein [Methylophaga sp.]MAY18617.1 hypothetical protein [Methylophaga sp.]MBN46383.1 hypothetical protein [Methylophaga sp.]HAO26437.1 hypothetical protein [Methylophaga sp.]HCD05296.1 hypothetical protein [Methylophaga sp.]